MMPIPVKNRFSATLCVLLGLCVGCSSVPGDPFVADCTGQHCPRARIGPIYGYQATAWRIWPQGCMMGTPSPVQVPAPPATTAPDGSANEPVPLDLPAGPPQPEPTRPPRPIPSPVPSPLRQPMAENDGARPGAGQTTGADVLPPDPPEILPTAAQESIPTNDGWKAKKKDSSGCETKDIQRVGFESDVTDSGAGRTPDNRAHSGWVKKAN